MFSPKFNAFAAIFTINQVEGEGFEPPVPFGTTVFKTVALNHSANPPN